MANIVYGGKSYVCATGVSVLDCLSANNLPIPSSCRAGLCQSCLMRALKGKVPSEAQKGLKPTLAAQNYFLACVCHPEEDLEVSLADASFAKFPARVVSVSSLSAEITQVSLLPSHNFDYKAGQFISLYKDDITCRAYSLASVPNLDDCLQLHVRRIPGGLVSTWIHDELQAGDVVDISEAGGDCFYLAGNPEQQLLLIGTGSGLAPLFGIIRDALNCGHSGPIRLYHGSLNTDGLYLVDELRALAAKHPNFTYIPCVSEAEAPEGFAPGIVLDVALAENPKLSGWSVFLCGNPDMVNNAKMKTYLAGASLNDIHCDPFLPVKP